MGRLSKEEKAKRDKEEIIIPDVIADLPVLVFAKSGWCEELGKSYRQGVYKPKDKKEYEALKKFAK